MTPLERYTYLRDHWKKQVLERQDELNDAKSKFEHWSNELAKAEIAEQMANEK